MVWVWGQGTVGVPEWPGYEVRVQLVFPSGLGMRSGYSWCSRVSWV